MAIDPTTGQQQEEAAVDAGLKPTVTISSLSATLKAALASVFFVLGGMGVWVGGHYQATDTALIAGNAPAPSATTDTTNADNITSGTLPVGRLPPIMVPAPPGGNVQDLGKKLANRVDLTDFFSGGCNGNDIAPALRKFDTALSQSAYQNGVNGVQGTTLHVPPGNCPIGSNITITHPMRIEGSGQGLGAGAATGGGGTYFTTGSNFTDGDIFTVQEPSGRGVTFARLSFNSGPARTSGAAIHAKGVANQFTQSNITIDNVGFLNQYDDVECDGCSAYRELGGTIHTAFAHDGTNLQALPGVESSATITDTYYYGETSNCSTKQNANIEAHTSYLSVHDAVLIGSQYHVKLTPDTFRSGDFYMHHNVSEEAAVEDVLIGFNGLPWGVVSITNTEFSSIVSGACSRGHVLIPAVGQVFTATVTSGSNSLSNISNPAFSYVNEPVAGSGIPPGAILTSVNQAAATATFSGASATSSGSAVPITHSGPWIYTVDISHNVINSSLQYPGATVFSIGDTTLGSIKHNLYNANGQNGGFMAFTGYDASFADEGNQWFNAGANAVKHYISTITRGVTLIDRQGLPASVLSSLTGAADGSCLFVTGAAAPSPSLFGTNIQGGSANANAGLLNGAWVYGC